MNLDEFEFGCARHKEAAATVTVPAAISTKESLLEVLSSGLSFPEYFGSNWDALEECLRDLDWLPAGSIVINHEELPSLDSHSLRTYLSILKGAVEKWRQSLERELHVSFPLGAEEAVAAGLEAARLMGQS